VLTEIEVIRLVRTHLVASGWEIISFAMPNEQGPDVVTSFMPPFIGGLGHVSFYHRHSIVRLEA
jgi:hypothetical protein